MKTLTGPLTRPTIRMTIEHDEMLAEEAKELDASKAVVLDNILTVHYEAKKKVDEIEEGE